MKIYLADGSHVINGEDLEYKALNKMWAKLSHGHEKTRIDKEQKEADAKYFVEEAQLS